MHLPHVDIGGSRLTQGFVRVRWPSGDRLLAGRVANWSQFFVRSTLLWEQLRPLSIGIRLAVSPGEPLTSVHSFVVPQNDEARLRLVLAAFLRTSGISGADADVPMTEQDLPGVFIHPDDARLAVDYERLSTNRGSGVHLNLRLADLLPRLMQTMADLGIPAAYETNTAEWVPPRDMLRSVLYDVARLEQDRSVPADLIRDQRALAARLKTAAQQRPAWHVQECLATLPGSAAMLRQATANLLRSTNYGLLGIPPKLRDVDTEQAEAFSYHVHAHVMGEMPTGAYPDSVAATATKAQVDGLVSCSALIPGASPLDGGGGIGGDPLFTSLSGPPGKPRGGGPERGVHPPGGTSGGAFLFVSYARADSDAVHPIVDALNERGVSLWVDRHLSIGDDWMAELEARLLECAGVLALISPSFAGSKFCARELHFADALNRPILPVSLVPGVALARGLRFLMNTIQMIDLSDDRFMDRILLSIRQHAAPTLVGCG